MYETILVPTDGSDQALRAAEHARILSRAFDAAVRIVTVVDLEAAGGPFDAGGLDAEFVDRHVERGRERVESVRDALGGGDDVTTDVVKGRPEDAILAYAEDEGADLIAMGTHGRSGLKRFFVGSVAERVVRRADVPVTTTRVTDGGPVADGYDDVLVPTDGSEHAGAAAEHAIVIAQRYDARVHAVNVVDVSAASTTPDVAPPTTLIESLESVGDDATESVASRAREAGLDARTEVRRGFPVDDVLDYAEENDVDLIAMGTAGRTGLDRVLLGNTATEVVRRSTAPVLTVPAADAESES